MRKFISGNSWLGITTLNLNEEIYQPRHSVLDTESGKNKYWRAERTTTVRAELVEAHEFFHSA